MIDRQEWRKMPLIDRVAWLADSSEDSLLTEALREVLARLADGQVDILRSKIADLETEIKRLERVASAPTPY